MFKSPQQIRNTTLSKVIFFKKFANKNYLGDIYSSSTIGHALYKM